MRLLLGIATFIFLVTGCDFVSKTLLGNCYLFENDDGIYKLLERDGLYGGKFMNIKTRKTFNKQINDTTNEISCL